MVRLTDLIRGTKTPPEGLEKEAPAADAQPVEAGPSPAPEAPPIQLRVLKGQTERQMSEAAPPSSLIEVAPDYHRAVGLRTIEPEVRPEPPAPLRQATSPSATEDWYGRAEASLAATTKAIRQQQAFTLGDLPQIASGMVSSLSQDDRLLVRAVSHQNGPSLVGNMVHSAIYAVKIGMGMGYRPDELDRVALAALVHDVGMFRLPQEMLDQAGRWSKEQIETLHRHPTMGADLLKQAAPDEPWLLEIVAQEHERMDGTGYPRGLQSSQIHEYAQVVGLSDVLDAMLRSRPTRKPLLPHEAVRLLLSREKSAFLNKAFKSLLQQFSLFPVGTWVKLTSGETGEVVRANPNFPLRPLVKIMVDQSGHRLRESKELDLSGSPLVHVAEIVDKIEMAM